jgi:hypothetical protein
MCVFEKIVCACSLTTSLGIVERDLYAAQRFAFKWLSPDQQMLAVIKSQVF